MTSPGQEILPDIVRDSRIETQAVGDGFQHVFHEVGRSARERRFRRIEHWTRERVLGRGSYGVVYLERHQHDDGKVKLRAVKEINKTVGGRRMDYARELEAVMKFSNRNYAHCFVKSDGWFEVGGAVYITMEYLRFGDLQKYLLARPLPEHEARQITAQVREGLSYMHENGFVHRDLKPANIMVVSPSPEWFVKITDFGISKRRIQGVATISSLDRGTHGFIAPEVLGFHKRKSYSYPVDMWSLGALSHFLLTKLIVFESYAGLSRYAENRLAFPKEKLKAAGVSDEAQEFVAELMRPCPEDRLSATAAARRPWMTAYLDSPVEAESSPVIPPAPLDSIGFSESSEASKAWSTENIANQAGDAGAKTDVAESEPSQDLVTETADELEGQVEATGSAGNRLFNDKLATEATIGRPSILERLEDGSPGNWPFPMTARRSATPDVLGGMRAKVPIVSGIKSRSWINLPPASPRPLDRNQRNSKFEWNRTVQKENGNIADRVPAAASLHEDQSRTLLAPTEFKKPDLSSSQPNKVAETAKSGLLAEHFEREPHLAAGLTAQEGLHRPVNQSREILANPHLLGEELDSESKGEPKSTGLGFKSVRDNLRNFGRAVLHRLDRIEEERKRAARERKEREIEEEQIRMQQWREKLQKEIDAQRRRTEEEAARRIRRDMVWSREVKRREKEREERKERKYGQGVRGGKEVHATQEAA